MTTLLRVRDLHKRFGGVRAVAGVGFELDRGERLAIIGPNGAGKSTCFNLLGGQLRPDSGSVRLAGRELIGLSPRRIARLGVGRTFQVATVFASMTLLENLQLALLAQRGHSARPWRRMTDAGRDEAQALLARVGMVEQTQRSCAVLAYGDLKRVELAVALAGGPQLLLLDEPTAGMAPAERHELMALISRIACEDDLAVLFTEHDMESVFRHADRILVLDQGEVIALDVPAKVRSDPWVQQVYLGED
ncbi:MAG: ABC transporter ATP-binding protein [Candidatus Competibacterales bacterium]|nr:ABC transporter ATP-binding protein [Candidatus Competibacterales bacterium]